MNCYEITLIEDDSEREDSAKRWKAFGKVAPLGEIKACQNTPKSALEAILAIKS